MTCTKREKENSPLKTESFVIEIPLKDEVSKLLNECSFNSCDVILEYHYKKTRKNELPF